MSASELAARTEELSYRRLLQVAFPLILANAAVPLLGWSDTAILGHFGSVEELGAIALGSLVFNFIFWIFGFLRMVTTGLVAQAEGAGEREEVRVTLVRGLFTAFGLGLLLLVLQWPLRQLALSFFPASEAVLSLVRSYFAARMWGAPASLGLYVIFGTLIGLGQTRRLLLLQLFLNGLNIALDVFFAAILGWGVRGIAGGTSLTEWIALGVGLFLLREYLPQGAAAWSKMGQALRRGWSASGALWRKQGDILVRTFFLLLGFAWFTRRGAELGDVELAGNHILLQLVSFCAFFLDGFAFTAESVVGRAVGARDPVVFSLAVRRTSVLAGITSALLALLCWGLGGQLLALLTDLPEVLQVSQEFLPWVSAYILCAAVAFQLDGIFLGALQTRELRNASVLSALFFLGVSAWGLRWGGNHGLWFSFVLYAAARAISLGRYYPRLVRSLSAENA